MSPDLLELTVRGSLVFLVLATFAITCVPAAACADEPTARTQDVATKDLLRRSLPSPVYDEHPEWVNLYWRAWEILWFHIQTGTPENGFAEKYLGDASNPSIRQWDTCSMALFARYGSPIFPAMASLDNFYTKQREDGFICREISKSNGSDSFPPDSDQAINPPLFAWCEWEYYRTTGDNSRFARVLPHLVKYFDWIKANRRRESGLYWQSNPGSGMDSSPRSGYGWIDLTAQQALAARYIARIARVAGASETAPRFDRERDEIKTLLNSRCWDPAGGLYYDVEEDGRLHRVKTAASFWPMIAEVVEPLQVEQLAAHLKNPSEFNRPHRVPTLSADNPKYCKDGGNWLGSVYAPTNYAIVKGLDACDQRALAREIAVNHITNMSKVLIETDAIWENYAPESAAKGNQSQADFVGWSGLGPIAMFIEDVIGLEIDTPGKRITWRITDTGRHGVERLHLGDNIVSLVAGKVARDGSRKIEVDTQKEFDLCVYRGSAAGNYRIRLGRSTITLVPLK